MFRDFAEAVVETLTALLIIVTSMLIFFGMTAMLGYTVWWLVS